jgi:hypothetical protein
MPTYVYKTANGKRVELTMTIAEMEARQRKNGTIRLPGGKIGRRDYSAESLPATTPAGCWPMENWAIGVTPQQRFKAMREAAAGGVPTEFNDRGRAIIRSRKHYKEYCRFRGVRNFDAGYSDAD